MKLLSYNRYKNDIIRNDILTLSIGGQSQSKRVVSSGRKAVLTAIVIAVIFLGNAVKMTDEGEATV